MTAKRLSISLIFLYCTVILVGQKVTSEGTNIVLNKGKQSQTVIQPQIHIIKPTLDEEMPFQTTSDLVEITGKVYNHEGIGSVVVNGSPVPLNGDGYFTLDVKLQPGVQLIKVEVYANANDEPVNESFNVEYNTAMMLFAKRVAKESDYYALIIGINDYSDSNFGSLESPVRDARNIQQVLTTKYTFETDNITFLENATRMQIERALNNLIKDVKPNDNLLIFFAGHGIYNKTSDVGYWIPSDAEYNSYNTYFTNSRLVDFIKEIQAKHTLVIADACFAGSIFNKRSVTKDSDKEIQELYGLPSCKAMTSTSYEDADDRSAFAIYLIEELRESDEDAFTAVKLYSEFHQAVKDNGGSPFYSNIKINKDRGGEFVFIRRQD